MPIMDWTQSMNLEAVSWTQNMNLNVVNWTQNMNLKVANNKVQTQQRNQFLIKKDLFACKEHRWWKKPMDWARDITCTSRRDWRPPRHTTMSRLNVSILRAERIPCTNTGVSAQTPPGPHNPLLASTVSLLY